jgi:hypothetical protein
MTVLFPLPLKVKVVLAGAENVPVFVKLPATLKLNAAVIVTDPSILRFAQFAATPTVIAKPTGTSTFSVANGTCPKDQLPGVPHAPDVEAVFVCAFAYKTATNSINTDKINFIAGFVFNSILIFNEPNKDTKPEYQCQ